MIEIKPIKELTNSSVTIPGSKSYTNRSLLMAALTSTPVLIRSPLMSEDTDAMINCLKKFGIKIETQGNDLLVKGCIKTIEDKLYQLDANLSGTTVRFLMAFCCIVPGTKILKGKESLNRRPVGELVLGLRQLGAQIEYLEREGFPPVGIRSSKLRPGVTKLKGDISSQYFSAILMIAPLIGEITIEVIGKQISKPYIDMTIDTMEKFGVEVVNDNYQRYIVSNGQRYLAKEYTVEGDVSSAGYFFGLAVLNKLKLTLKNLNPYSKQADMKFLNILEQMGSKVTYGKNEITIEGRGVCPVEVDMEDCPDQVQTMAVLAAFAKGKTIINGVSSLRIKETERVKALETELLKMEITTESTQDTLVIHGGEIKPAVIDTYTDHRMAMSFALAGTKIPGVKINNPEVVNKTFPEFWEKLQSLGVEIVEGVN